MKIRCLGILVCLLAATSLFAAGGNANLQPLEGAWHCTGIAFANEMAPEHPTVAHVRTSWTLGDKWMQVWYSETKTAKNPHPIAAELLMGYDEAKKTVVSGSVVERRRSAMASSARVSPTRGSRSRSVSLRAR